MLGFTVSCPLADSFLQTASSSAGAVAELAATCQVLEYSELDPPTTCFNQ